MKRPPSKPLEHSECKKSARIAAKKALATDPPPETPTAGTHTGPGAQDAFPAISTGLNLADEFSFSSSTLPEAGAAAQLEPAPTSSGLPGAEASSSSLVDAAPMVLAEPPSSTSLLKAVATPATHEAQGIEGPLGPPQEAFGVPCPPLSPHPAPTGHGMLVDDPFPSAQPETVAAAHHAGVATVSPNEESDDAARAACIVAGHSLSPLPYNPPAPPAHEASAAAPASGALVDPVPPSSPSTPALHADQVGQDLEDFPDHDGITPHTFHVGDVLSKWDARCAQVRYMKVVGVRDFSPAGYGYTVGVFVGENFPLEIVEMPYGEVLEKDCTQAAYFPPRMLLP